MGTPSFLSPPQFPWITLRNGKLGGDETLVQSHPAQTVPESVWVFRPPLMGSEYVWQMPVPLEKHHLTLQGGREAPTGMFRHGADTAGKGLSWGAHRPELVTGSPGKWCFFICKMNVPAMRTRARMHHVGAKAELLVSGCLVQVPDPQLLAV